MLGWIFFNLQQRKKTNRTLATQNATIAAQNAEKETLLKEIHHRVKNNLGVVSSLLDLQAGNVEDEAAVVALEDGQSRVRSMALIHQYLYQHDNIGRIAFADYMQGLTQQVATLFDNAGKVKVELQETNIQLDIDTAVPMGLILNELLTNAYKYAFADREDGTLTISATEPEPGNFRLVVTDNGPGLPEDFDLAKTRSLGLRLVRRLSRQLYGTAEYTYADGAQFTVTFKATEVRKEVQ